jgi:hypothetical protein
MGKESRRHRTSTDEKAVVSMEDRHEYTAHLLAELAKQGVTMSSTPSLKAVLPRLAEYRSRGDRLLLTLTMPEIKAKLTILLPRYANEQPRARLEPIAGA